VAGKAVIYHVAGCLRATRVEQYFRVNEEGTRNVVRACAELERPPVVVIVSSVAAAGASPEPAKPSPVGSVDTEA
jgi:nucleoside-diphosphate-sugar epimerase